MNNLQNTNDEQNDVIIYQSKDGKINVALMTRDGNVWQNIFNSWQIWDYQRKKKN